MKLQTARHQGLALVQWFEKQRRILPWREEPTPYRVWISEIMLQQTQVITVLPYFERFVAEFPSVDKLAQATEAHVLGYWAGLGYYSRARNIHATAKRIVEKGCFPSTREQWQAMPGVGPYTAGAILSISQNLPEAILDGNVERVLSRFHQVSRLKLGETDYKKELWRLSKNWVQGTFKKGGAPSQLNQALMELGALVCTPKNFRCGVCPLQKKCAAYASSSVHQFPEKKKRKPPIQVSEQRAFIQKDKHVFLVQQQPGEWWAGLWDFPKLSAQELVLLQKNGVLKKTAKATMPESVIQTQHVVTHHKIKRSTYVLVKGAQAIKMLDQKQRDQGQWFLLSDLLESQQKQNPGVALGSAPRRVIQVWSERF